MTLREKFELMERNCDADHRTLVRAHYIERYGVEPDDLSLMEVLGDYDAEKFKLGAKAGKPAA